MSKTLSNGTLSLRFMQNAQRAKQQAQVELEQAKIKDDAEWEMPQEVKDAWGIGSSPDTTRSSSVTHESSYLPFIFASSMDESSSVPDARPRGRRKFNERGQEVKPVDEPPPEATDVIMEESQPSTRITSISGFKVPIPIKQKDKKVKMKTAQELIREDAIRQPPAGLQTPQSAAGFRMPAGVDAPAARTNTTRREGHPRLKRERSSESGDILGSEGKKRKKKDTRMID
ncbi:hypothetical protein PHLCEN_2v11139 [Hermanssonia centrifuga]|uniref:Uncharacterized protein n=1 Tax=Hermanssonia centrifuga TaxID=98765 RepID=A0A2R6NKX2_9APHY|nr:hypothetical protein PHLCEN_2v11139 [Hermanssonia centrifuga]